tara:strand:+ start:118 stop:678 length:561 start_codon:yes stop_codon:yes gene_type:complete
MDTHNDTVQKIDIEKNYDTEHQWSLYAHYWTNERKNYTNDYEKIHTVSTVQDFWRMFNNIPNPSSFLNEMVLINGKQVVTFSFFKSNIKPEWEDEHNEKGSEWCYRDHNTNEELDTMWRDMCLYAIGCQIECNGIRVTYKYNPSGRLVQKTEIWLDHTDGEKEVLRDLCEKFSIAEFQWHYFLHSQ